MAIPLWRQYTRLSADQRRAILERRRRRLDEASNRREVLNAFLEDARDVRTAYGDARRTPPAESTPAASDGEFNGFSTPGTRDFGQSIGVQNQGQLDSAISTMQQFLQDRVNRRWENSPVNARPARPREVTIADAREELASGSNIATQIVNSVR